MGDLECPIVGKGLLALGRNLHEAGIFCFAFWVQLVPRTMSNTQDALNKHVFSE